MKTLKRKKFTLIEIMVAIVIFSISALGLYSTMMVARSAQISAKDRLAAMKIIYERLEELQQVPFNKLISKPNTFNEKIPPNLFTAGLDENINDYSPKLDLLDGLIHTTGSAPPDSTSSDRVWRVDCTVTWTDASSEKVRSQTSYIYVYDTEVK